MKIPEENQKVLFSNGRVARYHESKNEFVDGSGNQISIDFKKLSWKPVDEERVKVRITKIDQEDGTEFFTDTDKDCICALIKLYKENKTHPAFKECNQHYQKTGEYLFKWFKIDQISGVRRIEYIDYSIDHTQV